MKTIKCKSIFDNLPNPNPFDDREIYSKRLSDFLRNNAINVETEIGFFVDTDGNIDLGKNNFKNESDLYDSVVSALQNPSVGSVNNKIKFDSITGILYTPAALAEKYPKKQEVSDENILSEFDLLSGDFNRNSPPPSKTVSSSSSSMLQAEPNKVSENSFKEDFEDMAADQGVANPASLKAVPNVSTPSFSQTISSSSKSIPDTNQAMGGQLSATQSQTSSFSTPTEMGDPELPIEDEELLNGVSLSDDSEHEGDIELPVIHMTPEPPVSGTDKSTNTAKSSSTPSSWFRSRFDSARSSFKEFTLSGSSTPSLEPSQSASKKPDASDTMLQFRGSNSGSKGRKLADTTISNVTSSGASLSDTEFKKITLEWKEKVDEKSKSKKEADSMYQDVRCDRNETNGHIETFVTLPGGTQEKISHEYSVDKGCPIIEMTNPPNDKTIFMFMESSKKMAPLTLEPPPCGPEMAVKLLEASIRSGTEINLTTEDKNAIAKDTDLNLKQRYDELLKIKDDKSLREDFIKRAEENGEYQLGNIKPIKEEPAPTSRPSK